MGTEVTYIVRRSLALFRSCFAWIHEYQFMCGSDVICLPIHAVKHSQLGVLFFLLHAHAWKKLSRKSPCVGYFVFVLSLTTQRCQHYRHQSTTHKDFGGRPAGSFQPINPTAVVTLFDRHDSASRRSIVKLESSRCTVGSWLPNSRWWSNALYSAFTEQEQAPKARYEKFQGFLCFITSKGESGGEVKEEREANKPTSQYTILLL